MLKSAPLWRVTAALLERRDASGKSDDDVASARLDGLGLPGVIRCREGWIIQADVRVADPELYAGGMVVCAVLLVGRAEDM